MLFEKTTNIFKKNKGKIRHKLCFVMFVWINILLIFQYAHLNLTSFFVLLFLHLSDKSSTFTGLVIKVPRKTAISFCRRILMKSFLSSSFTMIRIVIYIMAICGVHTLHLTIILISTASFITDFSKISNLYQYPICIFIIVKISRQD